MRVLCAGSLGLLSGVAVAQTDPATTELTPEEAAMMEAALEEDAGLIEVEEIVVVGSRRQTRSTTDTLAPVDVISIDTLLRQGSTDINDMLRTFVPAYNVAPEPASDASVFMRPPNLRGLPPDMTVVLVNGKRRHRGAIVTLLGSGVSDGAQGVDLASIPSIAIQRVEVLRDGAAAQYGADAIAGVLNIVLRDNREGATFQAQYGSYFQGDGDTLTLAGNWGIPITDKGFLNLSMEYSDADRTSRSTGQFLAQKAQPDFPAIPDIPQRWGSPAVSDNIKVFGNGGLYLGDLGETYLFGNYSRRSVNTDFFFRNPTTEDGVYTQGFPADDTPVDRLVADLNGQGNCPTVPSNNAAAVQSLFGNDAVGANCFVFDEIFPGGFTPKWSGSITDFSVMGGIRGESDSGFRWDLSGGVGQSEIGLSLSDTVNASLGPDTPTQFSVGSYRQTDQNLNLDLVYPLNYGFPVNVAGGVEYREEQFSVFAGDPESYEPGPLTSQGFSVGSQGFRGITPDQTGVFRRRNVAGYVDFEADLFSAWLFGLAGRAEYFDTFGSTVNFKASSRVTMVEDTGVVDTIAVRGTVGTGFRAPTPGQSNLSTVSTVGSENNPSILVDRGTIAPTNPVALAKGGKELDPETSLNVTAGLVLNFLERLSLTADYYYIEVRDRIALSAPQTLTTEEAQRLEASGVVGASQFEEFDFFTNAFDTTTQGVDVVGTFAQEWLGTSRLSLAYNWNRTTVESFTPGAVDDVRIAALEEGLPEHRLTLTLEHELELVRFLARMNYYDSFKTPLIQFGVDNVETALNTVYGAKVLFDVEAAVRVQESLQLIVGVQNLFNTFPDEVYDFWRGATGARFPENAPTGFNGGFWYVRAAASF